MVGRSDIDELTAIFKTDAAPVRPTQRSRRHVLVRMDGNEVGRVQRLEEATYSVGRHPESNIRLNVEGVSRRHAEIQFVQGSYRVRDLGSKNGTLIGGEAVESAKLKDGDVIQFGPLATFRYSITDRDEEEMLRRLYEASVRDALTGAYNREYLNERLRTEIAYATRHQREMSFILFDLDHFKQVNDNFGHQAGDAVLVEVAQRIAAGLRTEDILARYGGEEFALTLRGIDLEQARQLAERIRANTDMRFPYEGREIPVSLSLGVASLSCCQRPVEEELIAIADRRLYAAKRGGRNRVVHEG